MMTETRVPSPCGTDDIASGTAFRRDRGSHRGPGEDPGFTPEEAMAEAARCADCRNPTCAQGCPAQNHIPEFIAEIAAGRFNEAWERLAPTNPLMEILGRICPGEKLCQCACCRREDGRPIEIRRLEQFVADWHRAFVPDRLPYVEPNGKSVAIVGAGPTGLTCGLSLGECGFRVVIIEQGTAPGGALSRGDVLPSYIDRLVKRMERRGCAFRYRTSLGRDVTLEELREHYDAVFLATGVSGDAELPEGLALDADGRILTDEHCRTSLEGVFAGGDAVTGRRYTVDAMTAGKQAAAEIFSIERDW